LPARHVAAGEGGRREAEALDGAAAAGADSLVAAPKRVLVVEDEALIAFQVIDALEELGWEVVGPAASLAAALELAGEERLDGAVLDVNLRGSDVYPVARLLDARGVPLVFTTGYRAAMLPEPYRDRPKVSKPFEAETLVASVVRAFGECLDAAAEPARGGAAASLHDVAVNSEARRGPERIL
jgi:CheY-like chemotaxis protein